MGETATILKSTCRSCHGGCGVLLHVQGDRLVKIEGDRESPLNHGRLCYFPVSNYTGDVSPECIIFWGHNPTKFRARR